MILEVIVAALNPVLPWLQLSSLIFGGVIVPLILIWIIFKLKGVRKMLNVVAEMNMKENRDLEKVMKTPAQSFIDEADTSISDDVSKTKVEARE